MKPLARISAVISDLTLLDIATAQGLSGTKKKVFGKWSKVKKVKRKYIKWRPIHFELPFLYEKIRKHRTKYDIIINYES